MIYQLYNHIESKGLYHLRLNTAVQAIAPEIRLYTQHPKINHRWSFTGRYHDRYMSSIVGLGQRRRNAAAVGAAAIHAVPEHMVLAGAGGGPHASRSLRSHPWSHHMEALRAVDAKSPHGQYLAGQLGNALSCSRGSQAPSRTQRHGAHGREETSGS